MESISVERSLRDPSPGGGRRLYTVHYIPVRARTWGRFSFEVGPPPGT